MSAIVLCVETASLSEHKTDNLFHQTFVHIVSIRKLVQTQFVQSTLYMQLNSRLDDLSLDTLSSLKWQQ